MSIPTNYFASVRRDPTLVSYWRQNDIAGAVRAVDYGAKYNLNGFYNGSPVVKTPLIYNDTTASSRAYGGAEQGLEVPDASPLRITGDITIATWLIANAANPTGNILAKMNSGNTFAGPYKFFLKESKLGFSIGNGAEQTELLSESPILTRTSIFVVATSFRKKMTLYVNGISFGSTTLAAKQEDKSNPVFIGMLEGGSENLNGYLGETALYSGGCSAAKALRLYNIGRQTLSETFRLTTFDVPSYS